MYLKVSTNFNSCKQNLFNLHNLILDFEEINEKKDLSSYSIYKSFINRYILRSQTHYLFMVLNVYKNESLFIMGTSLIKTIPNSLGVLSVKKGVRCSVASSRKRISLI